MVFVPLSYLARIVIGSLLSCERSREQEEWNHERDGLAPRKQCPYSIISYRARALLIGQSSDNRPSDAQTLRNRGFDFSIDTPSLKIPTVKSLLFIMYDFSRRSFGLSLVLHVHDVLTTEMMLISPSCYSPLFSSFFFFDRVLSIWKLNWLLQHVDYVLISFFLSLPVIAIIKLKNV